MSGFRRYAIVAIGVLLGAHAGFGTPIGPEEWQGFASSTGSFVASALALWSALKPTPAAGTGE